MDARTILRLVLGVSFVVVILVRAGSAAEYDEIEYACSAGADEHPYCDRALPLEARVADLVSLLTLAEKVNLLTSNATAIGRLGIPAFNWWNEALHGVAISGGCSFRGPVFFAATIFPQTILTASAFNLTLVNKIAQAISTEARAISNLREGYLAFWSPNVNIFRDPRWGRGQETPGEDPLLTSLYGEYFVRGIQEDGDYDGDFDRPAPTTLKASACCKHLTAYDVDLWKGSDRHKFNAVVSQRDLDDTFNPPFKACILKGRASGLMCSYNSVNGVPTCADPHLLRTLTREKWEFEGYIVSDCDAVSDLYLNHDYAKDFEHSAALAFEAGVDVICEFGDHYALANSIQRAVEKRVVSSKSIDDAVSRALNVLFRLGLFDGNPLNQPYGSLGPADVCSESHQQLALDAALQGIVLLKNLEDALPLSRDAVQNLAVIGPNADDHYSTMLGDYAGPSCTYVTPRRALQAWVKKTQFVAGCSDTACEMADFDAAISAAATADATIIVTGLSLTQEKENIDRESLLLPGQQQELVVRVAANARGPVVLVVMSGSPVDISFAKDNPMIKGILWVGYPGESGGSALAQIIFGDANPGGKLTMTWYPESFTDWPMTKMDMRPDAATGYPGRTYRFYNGPTVYNFGDGLSYSHFTRSLTIKGRHAGRSMLVLPEHLHCYYEPKGCSQSGRVAAQASCRALEFTAEVAVANRGWREGSDVVLLYAVPPFGPPGAGGSEEKLLLREGAAVDERQQRLVDFRRVRVEGHARRVLEFTIRPCDHFSNMQIDGTRQLLEGLHTLSANREAEITLQLSNSAVS